MSTTSRKVSTEGIESDAEIFYTPALSRNESISPMRRNSPFISPIKSPGKRGIIRLGKMLDSVTLSPIRTPNGRAGLLSPKKRSLMELNNSARKRAVQSTIYSRLMDEYDDEDENDHLNRQDRNLAESILRNSRNEPSGPAYGSDVEFEEEDLEDKPRPKRRKASMKKIKMEEEEDLVSDVDIKELSDISVDDLSSDEVHSDDVLSDVEEVLKLNDTPKRTMRRRGASKIINTRKSLLSPTKLAKVDLLKAELTKGDLVKTELTKGDLVKRRVGRPSKSENVIGNVKSIFQMDDEKFFKENKARDIRKVSENSLDTESESNAIMSAIFNTTETTTIPVISGIPSPELKKDTGVHDPKKEFTPLKIPRVDELGNICDTEFLKEHFSGNRIESSLKGRFLDEKAFFLEGSEGYFEQHSCRPRTSNNSLAQLAPKLDYSTYIPFVDDGEKISADRRDRLFKLHKSLYHQWCFELTQEYNLNFYGVGSKLSLLMDFVLNYIPTWFETSLPEEIVPNILVVNGYNPTVKFKRVLQDIVSSFISQETKRANNIKFPKHVSETVPFIINYVESRRKYNDGFIKPQLIILIHNIDGEAFRDEKTQNYLSQLCSLPEIWLISSTDNINAPLLWDLFKMKNFNFLWHDLTTYKSYSVEMSFKDVLNMGRSKKFVGDKGAKYVLSSLTSNARKLYRVLLEKQIEVMKSIVLTKAARNGLKGSIKNGIDFKTFYNSCLEEFITSNEISFRTVLGEFVEHKMCKLIKDDAGVEMVFVPFNFDEMEKLLEEEFHN